MVSSRKIKQRVPSSFALYLGQRRTEQQARAISRVEKAGEEVPGAGIREHARMLLLRFILHAPDALNNVREPVIDGCHKLNRK